MAIRFLAPLIFVSLATSACVHSQAPQATQVHDEEVTAAAKKEEERRNAEDARKKAEQDRERALKQEAEEKTKRIDPEYKAFLKTNKCETKYWSRYEFGGYFQRMADENKITPYDVIYGDAYARRNISSLVWYEAHENYSKYVINHLPDPIKNKFEQEFPSKEDKEANERAVFNASIKRDYECYKKLK